MPISKINIYWLFLLPLIIPACRPEQPPHLRIAVAANLKSAMDSVIVLYSNKYPQINIQVTYGSSGKFCEQIIHSAPFDLFFSADMNYPRLLQKKKLTISEVKSYATGQLAVWSKKFDPTIHPVTFLTRSSVKKISIANPASAPYGMRAIECLKYFSVYSTVKHKLVFGDNAAQAAQFVAFGSADVGIIALTDCYSAAMKKEGGKYQIIPQESHQPLEQGCVILKPASGNKPAVDFFDFISSPQALAVLTHYGYLQKSANEP